MLSDRDIQLYRAQGYLVLEGFFPRPMVAELQRVTEELTAASAKVTVSDDVFDVDTGHSPDNIRLRRIKTPTKVHASYRDALTTSRLLDAIECLIGPDIRLFGGKINMKLPGSSEAVEWHQDWSYYPHTNDDVLAVGVLLDDCGAENGPLLVLPGTHQGPVLSHETEDGRFCGAIDPAKIPVDLSQAAAITGPAGTVSIHHARLIHGSAVNRSARARRMMFIPYAAADAWPLLGTSWDAYRASIVRGRSTKLPRLEPVPVRLPLPMPAQAGSIFEIQQVADRRFFGEPSAKVA
jgi:phytanoyl-CoA hydroxylase